MPFIDGRKFDIKNKFEISCVHDIVDKLLDNKICHRDIKLDNIIFDKNNKYIAFIDWGEAEIGCTTPDSSIEHILWEAKNQEDIQKLIPNIVAKLKNANI